MEIVKGPTFRVHVDAPPERVYSYVADFTRHPEWSPDEMKIEAVTPGPTRVGSTYKAEGTLQGKRNRSELQVTALTPSSRIAFTATDKSGPLFHTFTFTSQDGGTLVERNLAAPRLPFPEPWSVGSRNSQRRNGGRKKGMVSGSSSWTHLKF